MHRIVALLVVTAGTVSMATETPKYDVLQTYAGFEVRRYGPRLVAETEVSASRGEAGNQAFGRLANYIFGGNARKAKIAMTAPVTQAESNGGGGGAGYTVQFTMPAAFTMETLPAPNDSSVRVRQVPERVVAVVRYSGTWSDANYEEHLAALRTSLAKEGLEPVGAPVWARYDPPYTPWFLRTNEIHLEVKAAPVSAR